MCATFLVFSELHINLIKEKRIGLNERTFQKEGSPYLAFSDRNAFSTSEQPKRFHAWSCQTYVMR